jgi:hypothetical protein
MEWVKDQVEDEQISNRKDSCLEKHIFDSNAVLLIEQYSGFINQHRTNVKSTNGLRKPSASERHDGLACHFEGWQLFQR